MDTWLAVAVYLELDSRPWVEPAASSGDYDDAVRCRYPDASITSAAACSAICVHSAIT